MAITGCELVKCPFWINDECTYQGDGCYCANLQLLRELQELAQRKHELWEEDVRGYGLTWREDSLAQEYQRLEDRVWEIKRELFGDCAIEI